MEEYQGISFPFRIGGRGGVVMSGRTNTVQQHLKEGLEVLLGTKEFERVMRPLNGLEPLDIFFNDLNGTTKNMAIYKITETIENYEPRVNVINVDIHEEEQVDGSMAHIITINYTERDMEEVYTVSVRV